ncbi:TPA: EpsG family protein [Aeromonas sobria]|nr:EpsG family protein [Aeromonas sobria]
MYLFVGSIVLYLCNLIFMFRTASFFISLLFPFVIVNIYFNGEDWINYYSSSMSIREAVSPEFTFYSFLYLLRTFSLGSYPYAILFFYFFIFFAIYNLFFNKNHFIFFQYNRFYFLFLSFIIFSLGATLILEQLRQLLALVIFMYSMSYFLSNKKNRAYGCMLLSITSHLSVVVLFFCLLICTRKMNKLSFVLSTFLMCFIVLLLCLSPEVFLLFKIDAFSFLYEKISRYLSVSTMGFGILHFLSLLYIFFYMFTTSDKHVFNFFEFVCERLVFSGTSLYLMSSFLPFLNRLSSYFVVLYALLIIMKLHSAKVYRLSFRIVILLVVCISTGVGYYRNSIAPLSFINLRWDLVDILVGDFDLNKRFDEVEENQLRKFQAYGYE